MLLNFYRVKKFILAFLCSFTFLLSNAENYITNYNRDMSANIHVGYASDFGHSTAIILGSLSVYGIYLDFGGKSPAHKHSTEVKKWEDETSCTVFHIGYQIPVYRNVKITPLFGSYKFQVGEVDGWDWSVSDHGINNHFEPEATKHKFDFGTQISLVYPVGTWGFNFTGTLTSNTWYIGIGGIAYF